MRDPEDVPAVAAAIRRLRGVDNVVYGQEIVQRLLQLGAVLRRVGIGVIALFVAVAGIIISNTIRLTVFARRREICDHAAGRRDEHVHSAAVHLRGFARRHSGRRAGGRRAWGSRARRCARSWHWRFRGCRFNVVQIDISSLVLQLLLRGRSGRNYRFVDSGRTLPADVSRDLLDELLAFKNLFEAAARVVGEGLVHLDERRRILRFNGAAERMLGCSSVGVTGSDFSLLYHPSNAADPFGSGAAAAIRAARSSRYRGEPVAVLARSVAIERGEEVEGWLIAFSLKHRVEEIEQFKNELGQHRLSRVEDAALRH